MMSTTSMSSPDAGKVREVAVLAVAER